jgi:DNA-directed RNA polymerase subunit E'/Rpb7
MEATTMNTDPLFERRELTRILDVPSKYVQRNIRGSLLAQLGKQVEGKCGIEGYVQPKSSVILEHSLGRVDMLHSGIQYKVKFHADVCYPHIGQVFKTAVSFRSKIGVHADMLPVKVLLPRDLHIGNTEFESITDKDEIIFEVMGAEFKQNDESIFVLGKLIQKVGSGGIVKTEEEAPVQELPPPPTSSEPQGEVKQVAIKPTAVSEAPKEPVRRRRRLNPGSALQLNVGEGAKGEVEGEP